MGIRQHHYIRNKLHDAGFAGTSYTLSNSVFIGDKAGKSTTGQANTFLGSGTGQFNTSGGYNTYVGWWTGLNNNGNRNVCIGPWAGMSATGDVNDDNVLIGYNAGWSLHGSGNILIGSNIGGSTYNNRLNIGDLITGDMSANTVRVLGSLSLDSGTSVNEFSTDGAMSGNSNTAVPTEQAVRTYISSYVSSHGDNLGNHTATQNIRLSGKYLSNDGGNEGLFVDTVGKVGIGTNAPSEIIHIKNGNIRIESTGSPYVDFFETGFNDRFGIYSDFSGYDNENRLMFTSNSSGSVPLESDAKMTMLQNGYIGIGTSTPSYLLQLSLNSAAKPSSSAWTISSDMRLKDLKGKYTKGLKEIIRLEPIVYQYKKNNEMNIKETDTDSYGFSAQDVQKIFPEAVTENDKGYLALDLHPVYVAQINAIKTLNSKIEILENENENLKKEIEEIKRLILKK